MTNHYQTELFNGVLEYHTYTAKNWFGIGGISHPLFKTLISRINSEVEDAKYFDLYVVGGILEDWVSWDVDFAVIGKYQPQRVYNVLDGITQIAFDLHLYCDSHFQETLWRPDIWGKYETGPIQHECFELSNHFVRDGEKWDLSHYEYVDGLYRKIMSYPFPKHVEKKNQGYVYKQPLKVN